MDFDNLWLLVAPIIAGMILMVARPIIVAAVDYFAEKAKLVGIEVDDAMRDKLHTALNSLVSAVVAKYVAANNGAAPSLDFVTTAVAAEVRKTNPETVAYFEKVKPLATPVLEKLAAQYVPGAIDRLTK